MAISYWYNWPKQKPVLAWTTREGTDSCHRIHSTFHPQLHRRCNTNRKIGMSSSQQGKASWLWGDATSPFHAMNTRSFALSQTQELPGKHVSSSLPRFLVCPQNPWFLNISCPPASLSAVCTGCLADTESLLNHTAIALENVLWVVSVVFQMSQKHAGTVKTSTLHWICY